MSPVAELITLITPAYAPGEKSWTAKLLADPALCCAKVREEAAELAATWEGDEGAERAASEAADLLYHSLVLLNTQVRTPTLPKRSFYQGHNA